MKNRILAIGVVWGVMQAGMAVAAQDVALQGFNDQQLGRALLDFTTDGVALRVELQGMSVGWHEVVVQEVGDCSNFEAIEEAGMMVGERVDNDLAVEERAHGGQSGIYVTENGSGAAQFILRGVNEAALRDEDGSALLVRKEDGKAVACGVIEVARP